MSVADIKKRMAAKQKCPPGEDQPQCMPIALGRRIGGSPVEDLDGLRERMSEQALGEEVGSTMTERDTGAKPASTKLAHAVAQLIGHWKGAELAPKPVSTAIDDMVSQGVPLEVATRSAWSAYRRGERKAPESVASKRVGLLSAAKHASQDEAVLAGSVLGGIGGFQAMQMAGERLRPGLTEALVGRGINRKTALRFAEALTALAGPITGAFMGGAAGAGLTRELIKSSSSVTDLVQDKRGKTGMPMAGEAEKPVKDLS